MQPAADSETISSLLLRGSTSSVVGADRDCSRDFRLPFGRSPFQRPPQGLRQVCIGPVGEPSNVEPPCPLQHRPRLIPLSLGLLGTPEQLICVALPILLCRRCSLDHRFIPLSGRLCDSRQSRNSRHSRARFSSSKCAAPTMSSAITTTSRNCTPPGCASNQAITCMPTPASQ